ncbi:TPA: restriction endonuclease subunit S [Vibrio vulnificus]|nr:restriction endonuclease subunit S [Vibrio vulnificus]
MSALKFVEKLLNGAGVEMRPISEVVRKTRNIKWKDTTASYRYIDLTSVDIQTKSITETTEITPKNAPSRAQKIVEKDDVIFATTRPTQMRYALIGNYYAGEIASSGYCVLRADQNFVLPKWIQYCISTTDFKLYLEEHQSGAAYPAISDSKVKAFEIPIPCPESPEKSLAIQAEIVRILDTFTELTIELITELATELKARKKQYNYYRNKLLSFENGEVEWKPLGEIGEFIRGKRFTKKDYVTDSGVKVIHYGEIYTHYGTSATRAISQVRADLAESLRYAEPNDVIVSSVSETIEDVGKAVAWLGEEKVAIHDDSYAIRHSLNPKYLSYCLQTENFTAQKIQYVSRGKVKRLLIDGASKVKIPVPYPNDPKKSRTEQDRIVAILEKFEMLTGAISDCLPREIELRKKQYEYYHDILLNFSRPENKEVV